MPFKRKATSQSNINGDSSSSEQMYEEYFHRVYAYVASHVEDQKDAEDIVSTVFLKAVQNFARFRGENLSSWLFTIAHHTLHDAYRKPCLIHLELEEDVIADEGSPEQLVLMYEDRAEILRHILSLSPRRQEVITLKFYAQLRNQEIAEVLGINEQSVASHLHRALVDLRDRLIHTSPNQVEQK